VRAEIAPDLQAFVNGKLNNTISGVKMEIAAAGTGFERVVEVPIYSTDMLVRRAPSLQKTTDAKNAAFAYLANDVATSLSIADGAEVRVVANGKGIVMTAKVDAGLAVGCVRVAAGNKLTAALGPMFGAVTVEKAAMAAAAE
jgi:NADH-quinone oxidoreductase subunit G